MAPETDPSAEPRTPLSRERVMRAAVAFADEHGIESLSMRKLARELGFGVMSLYNHVANKDDMLDGMVDLVAGEIDGMVDLVAGEIDPPAPGCAWKPAMRKSAISAHQVLMRHSWAGSLWSTRMPGPERLRYMESLLRGFEQAGFSNKLVYHGFHAVSMHIVGFTLQELNFQFDDEELGEMAAKFLEDLPADEYPHLTQHVLAHISGDDHDDEFGLVLDLILDGLDRLRDQQRPGTG